MLLSAVCASGLFLTTTAFAQAPGPGGGGAGAGAGQSGPQSMPQRQTPGTSTDANNTPANPPSSKIDDRKFMRDAALGGMTEVELGKLAVQKASSDGVKQFGQKMIDDHTKANDQLKELATRGSVQLPDSLDSKHQSRIDKLSKLSGEQFDKAYVKDQLKDHEADVKEFNEEAQNGSEPHVKAFAASTLPTLQQHLEMVKELNKSGKQMAKNGH